MTEIRIVRVGPQALTLLTDIRENALRTAPTEISEFLYDDYAELHEHATESSTHYFVGFKDHSPFAYLRASIDDGEAEIRGPFLYPEFFASGLGVQLVEHALRFVGELKTQVIYA
ncbi:MAG: GNAT family N-acetyltransferase, partial [Candidatus Zixiibacteriota bacterium]